MYALAKYANGNIDEILQRIDEGMPGFTLAAVVLLKFQTSVWFCDIY